MSYQVGVIPRFPARVVEGVGISIERANATYTFSTDYSNVVSSDVPDPAGTFVLVQLPDGSYAKVPLSQVTGAGTPSFEIRPEAVAATIASDADGGPRVVVTYGYATAGDGGGAKYIRTGGSTSGGFQSADGQWWALAERAYTPEMFGAFSSSADCAAAMQAAMTAAVAAGVPLYPQGVTYVIGTQLTIVSGQVIIGQGKGVTIFKLKDAANTNVFFAPDANNVYLANFTVDGNQATQNKTSADNWRGIFATGVCNGYDVYRVEVKNCVDHGLMMANSTTLSRCVDCSASGCGSDVHLAAGGAGGTGILSGNNTVFIDCYSTGNRLNGFKGSTGRWLYCTSEANGGGFETGSGTPVALGGEFIGCRAINNLGDGFRNQGNGAKLTFIGNFISGNANSGIILLNSPDYTIVKDNIFMNNGNGGARSATLGLDGLTLKSSATTGPASVLIDGNLFLDDQGSPTQEYGIYVDDGVSQIDIGRNIFSGNKIQAVFFGQTTADTVRFSGGWGTGGEYQNTTPASITGTLVQTDLMTRVIPTGASKVGSVYKIRYCGDITGVAGTKTIRLNVNGTLTILSDQLAAEAQEWGGEITLVRVASTLWHSYISAYENGGTNSVLMGRYSIGSGTDATIKLTGQLGNVGDTIRQLVMTVSTER